MTAFEKGLEIIGDLPESGKVNPTPKEIEDQKAVDNALDWLLSRILLLEGPPPRPLEGVSTNERRGMVRSLLSGKPLATAHTWQTGPWTCLVLDEALPALKRPKGRVKNLKKDEKQRFFVDSKSMKAMKRIVAACRSLKVVPELPLDRSVVMARFGFHQAFLAWRLPDPTEQLNDLMGDTDNYIKIVLDGLVRARVLHDDRGVVRLVGSKEPAELWDVVTEPVEALVEREAVQLKAAGEGLDSIRAKTGASWKQIRALWPDETHEYYKQKERDRAAKRAFTPELLAGVIARAKENDLTLQQAAKALHFPVRAVITVAVAAARAQILEHGASVEDAAGGVFLKAPALRVYLKDDTEARKALAKLRSAPRPKPTPKVDAATEKQFIKALAHAKEAGTSLKTEEVKRGFPAWSLREWAYGHAKAEYLKTKGRIAAIAKTWGMQDMTFRTRLQREKLVAPNKREKAAAKVAGSKATPKKAAPKKAASKGAKNVAPVPQKKAAPNKPTKTAASKPKAHSSKKGVAKPEPHSGTKKRDTAKEQGQS